MQKKRTKDRILFFSLSLDKLVSKSLPWSRTLLFWARFICRSLLLHCVGGGFVTAVGWECSRVGWKIEWNFSISCCLSLLWKSKMSQVLSIKGKYRCQHWNSKMAFSSWSSGHLASSSGLDSSHKLWVIIQSEWKSHQD